MLFKQVFFLFICLNIYGVNIDRVILGCDTNAMYLEFWPLVAKTWKEIVGIKPTVAFIGPKDFPIDETLGDVLRFEPIPTIPTSFQAQVIRLLLPVYFEDEICIISDMDMIPLQKDFFTKNVELAPSDSLVIFNNGVTDNKFKEYLMCYIVAQGKTFKEIFNLSDLSEIPRIIQEWYNLNLGWSTDQQILYEAIENWEHKNSRVIKLGYKEPRRIDRLNWHYDSELLKQKNFYVDSHMLRPYKNYKLLIDALIEYLDLK